jgi:formylglycine-generating enzyme required for sulfatase activity
VLSLKSPQLTEQTAVKQLLVVVLTVAGWGTSLANPETTVGLPGGATMKFVWIEPGTFLMGSAPSGADQGSDEEPRHEVTLSRGFWLGKYEVTQGQWEAVTGAAPWSGRDWVQADASRPAVCISWTDVQAFADRLSRAGGAAYRMPTEAEWEYACRAGTTARWSFGDSQGPMADHAWYHGNAWTAGLEQAQPVGRKLPNPWGLHDMHGNVYEWVQDWYGVYAAGAQSDPRGPTWGDRRVLRGGGFAGSAMGARAALRACGLSDYQASFLGARIVWLGPPPNGSEPGAPGEDR